VRIGVPLPHVSRGNVFEDLGFSPAWGGDPADEDAASYRDHAGDREETPDAAAVGKSARGAAAARERVAQRQDFANDGRLVGEVSVSLGAWSWNEDED